MKHQDFQWRIYCEEQSNGLLLAESSPVKRTVETAAVRLSSAYSFNASMQREAICLHLEDGRRGELCFSP